MQHLYKNVFLLPAATGILLLQSFCAGNLYAQSATNKAKTDTVKKVALKEVAIHADRLSSRNASASPVQILKGAELEKLNSLSVADAIRFFSGVQIKDYGGVGGLKTINVRSLGTNHTVVFYDGIEFGNSQNGQVDLGKFSLDNIGEIDLYSAQKSTIYQPAKGFSAGSSIYLTAKMPAFDEGRSNGKVSFKTGSFGLLNPSLFWQYKLSDNIYSTLSSEIIHANGRYKFRYTNGVYDTTAVRHNGDIDAQRIEAGLNGKLKDSSTFAVKGYLYNSNRGLPAAIVNNKFDSKQREWDRNEFVQASYSKIFSPRYSVHLNAKYADDYTHYFDPEITNLRGLLDDKYYEHEFYFSFANRYRINNWWDVAVSADYQRNTLDALQNDTAQYRFVRPTRNTILAVLATDVHFKRFNAQASLLGTFVNDTVDTLVAAGRKKEYTPALLLSWQPLENSPIRIRGFYKSIFRLPTFNDLYFTFIGNALLRPEFTKQYDLGFTYSKTRSQQTLAYYAVQIDGYYNQVRDKIVAIPGQNLDRWTMYNLGKVHIKGLEVNAQATWLLPAGIVLNTGISYTYQNAKDVTDVTDFNYNQQIPYTPVNSGSLLVNAERGRFSINYSFIYTGERYNEKANIPENYMQPWYTHDAGVTYTTNWDKHKIKLTGEINNLANQRYDVILNFPMPGRNYRFTISSTF
ncbi:MAG TPA: TonB-dependent receptor [Mucilaginibacter sp.]